MSALAERVVSSMRFAYADPPYYGLCGIYDHEHGDDGRCWDDLDTHRLLVARLERDYPDGWAMSTHSPALWDLLPLLPRPPRSRIAAWVKPFAAYKKNIRVAYTWEPVILVGGRGPNIDGVPVSRDHLAESITMRRGFTGAKPHRFNRWVLDMLGFVDDLDTLDDLYPGTEGMTRALAEPPLSAEFLTPPADSNQVAMLDELASGVS